MTQTAMVTAVPGPGIVEVTVARQTACGHDCEHCAGCGAAPGSITVSAVTELDLAPGDLVELYSRSSRILPIAALIYLGPVVLFLAGYLLPVGVSAWGRGLLGGVGFALGIVLAIAVDRWFRRSGNTVSYEVVKRL